LLVLLEDSSVRARLATARHLAEDGLLARWQNVISRRASTEDYAGIGSCLKATLDQMVRGHMSRKDM